MLKIKDLMVKKPRSIDQDKTIFEAVKLMAKDKVGFLPVIDQSNILVGVLSERDILLKAIVKQKDITKVRVAAVMTRKVISVKPDDDIFAATRIIDNKRIHHIPVQEAGRLVGLIKMKDVITKLVRR